ncbi:phosphoglycerate mutase-like protein [Pluteus cervinus]|uniref:Phosphoglycerate mutase-like protein n=1 Tax=Pluteus cervinus TaxID=181527 RepID=A0ACD3B2S6_9AGAR|nr:phosphoglycerate mutase-like protein [Pluteus cervinus]
MSWIPSWVSDSSLLRSAESSAVPDHWINMGARGGPVSWGTTPPQVPLDVENYPVAPEGLELQQVHVYVRHGERTPVGVRLAGPPANIPEHWLMCAAGRRARPLDLENSQVQLEKVSHVHKGVERSDGSTIENQCLLGELTDLGRQTTLNYGKALRKLYIDRLGLLPEKLGSTSEVYFRTTNMARTTETLQNVIHGLYPASNCPSGVHPTILIRNGKDENLLGNTYSCKRLELIQLGFAQAAAAAYNPTLEPLDNKLSKYLNGNGIRVDGKPRASGVMDTVRAAIAHGVKVPPEFEDPAIVDAIERAVITEWFQDKTEEGRRLGMGRLLEDLSRKMQSKVERGSTDPLKMLVHSTHDTALAALCQTLDVFDNKWPAFTASITFELFSKVSGGEPIVRMRYQNKNLALPICAEPGKHLDGHPEFCTFSAFKERVKELTPTDWEAECAPSGRATT